MECNHILAAQALQLGVTNCPFKATLDAELLLLIDSWERIPKHVRDAIVVLGKVDIE